MIPAGTGQTASYFHTATYIIEEVLLYFSLKFGLSHKLPFETIIRLCEPPLHSHWATVTFSNNHWVLSIICIFLSSIPQIPYIMKLYWTALPSEILGSLVFFQGYVNLLTFPGLYQLLFPFFLPSNSHTRKHQVYWMGVTSGNTRLLFFFSKAVWTS